MTGPAIRRLAENALAAARLAPPDPYAGIADPEQLARDIPELDLAGEDLPGPRELERMAKDAEAAALAVTGVTKSGGAGASASDSSVAIVISNGFAQGYRRTGTGVSVSAIAGDGTAMQRDYDFSSAIHGGDLRAPDEVGREAGERAVRRLDPRKVKSQTVPVIFDRRVAPSLIGHLLGAISGAAIARGTSFLKEALGSQVFPKGFEILEDPFRRRGLGSRPFDGEGLACRPARLVADGIITQWILDLRSARQLGLAPTGQGSRGGPSTSNVHIPAGILSPAELQRDIGAGLYVSELIGSSVNMVNGDYSRGASGFWIENGELAYPVSEITIAGNLKDMFAALSAASNLEFRSAVNAPNLRIDSLTIAGL
jgi:PmbA protein